MKKASFDKIFLFFAVFSNAVPSPLCRQRQLQQPAPILFSLGLSRTGPLRPHRGRRGGENSVAPVLRGSESARPAPPFIASGTRPLLPLLLSRLFPSHSLHRPTPSRPAGRERHCPRANPLRAQVQRGNWSAPTTQRRIQFVWSTPALLGLFLATGEHLFQFPSFQKMRSFLPAGNCCKSELAKALYQIGNGHIENGDLTELCFLCTEFVFSPFSTTSCTTRTSPTFS